MAITSKELQDKSLQAALSAIELYNKPDFRYREEIFAILMCAAWELLLKAKVLKDCGEDFDSIVAYRNQPDPVTGVVSRVPKTNRSKNLMTLGLDLMAARALEGKLDGYSKECLANTHLLIELRDNAVHLVNSDLALSEKVLAIGTASLKNYMSLATRWFAVDFSKYNFFLMPMSFFHGFEIAAANSVTPTTEQCQRFVDFLASVDTDADPAAEHHILLSIETRVVRGKGAEGVAVRWTADPAAPAMNVREESLLERYPYDTADLVKKLRERYIDFKLGKNFQKYITPLQSEPKYCRKRLYNPKNPKSGHKNFFSPEVFKVFDLHYTRPKKSE